MIHTRMPLTTDDIPDNVDCGNRGRRNFLTSPLEIHRPTLYNALRHHSLLGEWRDIALSEEKPVNLNGGGDVAVTDKVHHDHGDKADVV